MNPFNQRAGEAGSDQPEFTRASGEVKCEICGMEYWRHPNSLHRDFNGYPYLKVLCDDRLVKL